MNLNQWIERAQDEFKEKIKPITSPMATSDVYKKHLLQKECNLAETKKHDSSYFSMKLT